MAHALDRLEASLSDRYTIERELGAGGMAVVYLAEDLKHHRKVAVKVFRPERRVSIVMCGLRDGQWVGADAAYQKKIETTPTTRMHEGGTRSS
jgi:serine/threonine protein kinase